MTLPKYRPTWTFSHLALIGIMGSFLSFTNAGLAVEADKQSQKVESILDQLETKYLDRESIPLTYDEERTKIMAPPSKTKETLNVTKTEPIVGQTPNQKMLGEIQNKLNEYDNEVDTLEADARRFKVRAIQAANSDNVVVIEARLKDQKRSSLRNLSSRIDGSLTFSQMSHTGIWIPTASLTLYNGPMQPGEHTIEINAVVDKTSSEGLAISGWTPMSINQTFTFKIEPGKQRKHFWVEFDTPESSDGKPVVKLAEFEMKAPVETKESE